MRNLDLIGLNKGTDKSSKGHNYLCYYEMFFDAIRYKPINLLEIGVDKGASLLTWHEYFPHSEIHGIDIVEGYEYLHEVGIKTHVVDHSNKADLIMFGEQHPQYFDIIIEDGSHMSMDSILTFEILFKYLKSGGFYCYEDALCDYDGRWNKGASSIDYFKRLIENVNMSGNIPNDQICANKKEAVKKFGGSYWDLNIEWVFSSCGLFIIKKV